MSAVNDVGEPCAGEPHARFEEAGAGDGSELAMVIGESTPGRETGGGKAPSPTVNYATAPAPDPTLIFI
ncbi:hypothetical protein SAMN05421505_1222 [Sinosporangium album]|uniref:Uncharacterized protein n=1 Tax=Sinosporangium album TaxID=504805 RepID=A0A1G8F1E9_9ACTN|nr:hypothetical protein SAMN05421505_1222 [Sinosporangium album]